MNILISADLKLKNAIEKCWPAVKIEMANDLDEVTKKLASHQFDLLILDVDMPGNRKLKNLVEAILPLHKIAIFSSKDNNYELAKDLMLMGVHLFISQKAPELEIIDRLVSLLHEHNY